MPDLLRVIIVDDEGPARRRLQRLLASNPDIAVVGEAVDGIDAVERITALSPDVVLLDIRMPRLDGFGVITAVGAEAMPDVIFVTAYDEHAVRAFEVQALDYLLKPVAPDRLRAALDRARHRRTLTAAARRDGRVAAEQHALRAGALPLRIMAHDLGGRPVLVAVADTFLIRAQRNYVSLHTPHGAFRVRGTITALAARLDPADFLRVNRSDVVRLDAIRSLEKRPHGDVRLTLPDGSSLLWSRRYRARDAQQFAIATAQRDGSMP